MRRIASWLILFGIAVQACVPYVDSAVTQAPTMTHAASTEAGSAGLKEIPLPAGHGVEGGWFQLYFTDPSSPMASQMTGGLDGPLTEAIDGARLSVDAAIYSLSLRSVRQSLVRAHRRGVEVRVVMESDNMDESGPTALKDAGIPVLGDRHEGLMHNKFVVIDRSEVWTGSMNWTTSGTYSDRNNLIRIRSSKIAEDYEAEFNEMFVDDHFGPDTGRSTPNPRVTVEGTRINVYFSPDDHVQAALLDLLNHAQSSIDLLAYSFTSDPLSEALRKRAAAGVKVRGVMDADQVDTNMGTEYDRFRAAGLDIRLDGEPGLMHHKVMVVDGETVVLGSYNFTASAEKSNDENILIIQNPEIARQFLEEFRRIYSLAQP